MTTFPHLERAINEESWRFLQDNYPTIADAIEKEVTRGATAEQLRYYVMTVTQRSAVALRCWQAAQYLAAQAEIDDLPERVRP